MAQELKVIVSVALKDKDGKILYQKHKVYDRDTKLDTVMNWVEQLKSPPPGAALTTDRWSMERPVSVTITEEEAHYINYESLPDLE